MQIAMNIDKALLEVFYIMLKKKQVDEKTQETES